MSNVKVVIDCNYGDSGKGLMTDYFANEAKEFNESCIVVLSNGGAQRGHSVSTPEGIRHVFHHFGSGTFTGADTYLPEYFIVNPMEFRREENELKEINRVLVNTSCKITTPYDMIANQIIENSRGKNRYGSCGMGIWETEKRYAEFSWMGLDKLYNLFEHEIYMELEDVKQYHESRLCSKGIEIPDEWIDIWNSSALKTNFYLDLAFFFRNTILLSDGGLMRAYDTVIFENAQGLCLDQYFGNDDRYTTPSNTGLTNPAEMIKRYMPDANVEVCYVTRTYLTRHGRGSMDHECDKSEINPDMVDLTNIPNPFQESLRFGKIRVDRLRDRIYSDFTIAEPSWKKSLAITHLNEYPWNFPELFKEFDVVYESNGQTRNDIYERRIN